MSPVISTDVPEDLKDQIEDQQEEGESRSATVRRILRAGLHRADEPAGVYVPWPAGIAFLGWMLVMASWADAAEIVGLLGLLLVALGALFFLPPVQALTASYKRDS